MTCRSLRGSTASSCGCTSRPGPRVQLDGEAGTVVWPNGADFDPATLHDWEEQGPAMLALAAAWRRTTTPA